MRPPTRPIPTSRTSRSSSKTGWKILFSFLLLIVGIPVAAYFTYAPARNFMKFGLWALGVQTPPRLSAKISSLPENFITFQVRSPTRDFVQATGEDLKKLHETLQGNSDLKAAETRIRHGLKIDPSLQGLDAQGLEQLLSNQSQKSQHRLSQIKKLSEVLSQDPDLVQFEASLGIFASDEALRKVLEPEDKASRDALIKRDLKFSLVLQAHAIKRLYPKAFDKSQHAQLAQTFVDWTDALKSEAKTEEPTPESPKSSQDPKARAPAARLVWIEGYPGFEFEDLSASGNEASEPDVPHSPSPPIYLTLVGPDQFVISNSRQTLAEILNLALRPSSANAKSQITHSENSTGVLRAELNAQRFLKNVPAKLKSQTPDDLQHLAQIRADIDLNENLALELNLGFEGSKGSEVAQKLHGQLQGLLQMSQMAMAAQANPSDPATLDLTQPLSPQSAMQIFAQKDALKLELRENNLAVSWKTPIRPYVDQGHSYAKAQSLRLREDHASLTALDAWIKSTPQQNLGIETLELQRVRNPQDAEAHYYGSVGGLPDAYQTLAILINPKCTQTTLVQVDALYPELTAQDAGTSTPSLTPGSPALAEPLRVALRPLHPDASQSTLAPQASPVVVLKREAQQISWSPLIEAESTGPQATQTVQANGQSQSVPRSLQRHGDFVLRISYVPENAEARAPANSVRPQDLLSALQALHPRSADCRLQSGGPRLIYRKLSERVAQAPAASGS